MASTRLIASRVFSWIAVFPLRTLFCSILSMMRIGTPIIKARHPPMINGINDANTPLNQSMIELTCEMHRMSATVKAERRRKKRFVSRESCI